MAETGSIDNDTLEAVRARFLEPGSSLSDLLDRPPEAGRLRTGQGEVYVQLACELARREKANNKGPWWDYRRVTLSVRGSKEDVVTVMGNITDVFKDGMELVLPSGARFIRWKPEERDRLEQEPEKKDAQDVWKGTITGLVWSVRTD